LWAETGTRIVPSPVLPQTGLLQTGLLHEPHLSVALDSSAIAKLTPSDLQVLEGFFARRLDLPLATRQTLAERIARAVQAKSGLETPAGVSVETFLEAVARGLRDLARMR